MAQCYLTTCCNAILTELMENIFAVLQVSLIQPYYKSIMKLLFFKFNSHITNALFKPSAFAVIEGLIHLFPLWAAALHSHAERFGSDNVII